MYDRLTGTPPSPALLSTLETEVGGGTQPELVNAAMFIMDDGATHSSHFYRVTLMNFATPWTNRDQTVFAALNDYSATVIGFVRDDRDFRQILSDDVLYVGSADGSVSAFDAAGCGATTCPPLWTGTTPAEITGAPVISAGRVIVGSSNGAVTAFALPGAER